MAAPVVLVTGAGKGLGRAVCEHFHARGYSVVATDVDRRLLADLDNRERFWVAELDVTDTHAARAVAERIREDHGRLDILINNAGIVGYFPVAETDPDELVRHFQINSFGALRVTHACLGLLAEARGRVINISSESYRLRTPFQIYQSTKLALEGISDVLRRELVHLGVHVATIRPGAIETELFHAMDDMSNPVADSRLHEPFAKFAAMLARNPPARRSRPEEVAELVYRAATDHRRRPHYAINNMLSLRLMSWLPVRGVDWVIRRMLV